jgi:antitoxin VapB
MAMNIKNPEVEHLVEEVVELTGESKTEAVRQALQERKERLSFRVAPRRRGESFLEFLEDEIWPNIPESELGRQLTREEEEETLGYGPEGV